MFELVKKIFSGLINDLINGSNHTKCVSLSNQKCRLNLNLYQEFNTSIQLRISLLSICG